MLKDQTGSGDCVIACTGLAATRQARSSSVSLGRSQPKGPRPMPPVPDPAELHALYQQALAAQGAGQAEAALALYSRILAANPRVAEVHFQIARILVTAARPERALRHLKAAVELKPGQAAIWALYADAVLDQTDDAERRAFVASAKAARAPAALLIRVQDALAPRKNPQITPLAPTLKADVEALIALMRRGDFAGAEIRALGMHKRHPKVALIADILASAEVKLGKTDAAIGHFRKAIAADPRYAEARNNLGRLLLETGKPDAALVEIRKALKLSPGLALAHHNLGAALGRKGDVPGAIAALHRALALAPDLRETHLLLGSLATRAKDYPAAEAAFAAAVRLGDTSADTLAMLGQAQAGQGHAAVALASYDRALEGNPDHALSLGRKALLLQSIGDFSGAETAFRRAIVLEPDNAENYRVFAASHKLTQGDPLIAAMQARFEAPGTSDTDRRHLGFALAKAMEDIKDYANVFPYLNAANALMRQEFPYDITSREREVACVFRFFDGVDLARVTVPGCTDYAPIFVTGLPRSGTTLVEQIISSHSSVTGAGEVGHAAREAYRLMLDGAGKFRSFGDLSPVEIAGLGHDYAAHMRKGLPQAARITDKSIQTYTFMGLIKLALPSAKMIVVRRDPRDNLLSIYKNMFLEGSHLYAYSLRDLGRYYRIFEQVLAFWRTRSPGGFYEVEYERLVADPEAEIRKLIAACGLDWQDQCLNSHQNQRRVQTLSVFQVRQPIYNSSLQGWRRHEAELGELLAALEGGDGAA